jgi:hypothetical protein
MKRIDFLAFTLIGCFVLLFAEEGGETATEEVSAWMVKQIQTKEAGDFTAEVIGKMTSSQIRAITLQQLEGFDAGKAKALGVNKLLEMKEGQIDVVVRKHAVEQIDGGSEPNLSEDQLKAILTHHLVLDAHKKKINDYVKKLEKMELMDPSKIKVTTSQNIRAWIPGEIKCLDQSDIGAMNSWQIEELLENHKDKLTDEQKIWIIERTDLPLIVEGVIKDFSSDIMKKLTESQVIGLGIKATNALIETHFDDLEKDQVKWIYESKIGELTKDNKKKVIDKYKELFPVKDETKGEEAGAEEENTNKID